MDAGFAAFLGVSAVVICTPGQDTALTIRNTLLGGRPAGVATAVGVSTGQLGWTVAASFGLAALLVASEPAFQAVRLAGAAYVVVLGVQSLAAAIRPSRRQTQVGSPRRQGLSPWRALRQGVLSNLGNPKMAVFFTSLLPQFAPSADPSPAPMLALGLVFASLTLVWLSGYAVVIARLGFVFARPLIRRAVDALTGAVLTLFGVRLATEPR